MRLHLIISRHGLPATRILWTTTSSSSALGEYGTQRPASASMVASSRTPNIAFANGGYTIAQLLEDVNEVVPLETEPTIFDPEFSGQWGLEDYVVEVGGSECLHFMEVDGLLRDGDEVVIRALQLADLRARRLCGRHQITGDGKHLIDGVPFGMPFYKRTTANRPAITIPPRKKRRTLFSGWDQGPAYGYEDANVDADADEAGDGEWLPSNNAGFGKELSILPQDNEVSDMGTVIRHPVNYSGDSDREVDESEDESDSSEEEADEDESDSSEEEADEAEAEAEELEDELRALKDEFEEPVSQFIDIRSQAQASAGPTLRASSVAKRPSSADTQGRSSVIGASSLSSKRSRGEDSSPRPSKAVRFNKGEEPVPELPVPSSLPGSSVSSVTSDSSEASVDEDEDEDEDDDDDSSEEETATSSSSDSDSDSDDSSSSSEEDTSESEDEEVDLPPQKIVKHTVINPPGEGSTRTKKSNQRFKLRRRLSKLKELGMLPEDADFAALRAWEEQNGGWHLPDEASIISSAATQAQRKEQEQREFEARREKLLRDLASGGVDVDDGSEKENKPPQQPAAVEQAASAESAAAVKAEEELSTRRTLDIASSRRLLFGSLGVRAPRTKEDEEATRKRLAAKASMVGSRKVAEPQPAEEMEEESDGDNDWENKLVIKATECIYDDIELSAPPFPFEQRWDEDADALIRQRKGWGKKRKRKQRIQVYNGDEYGEYEDGNGYDAYEDNMQLNYDNEWPTAEDETTNMESHQEHAEAAAVDDLPEMPSNPKSVADLLERDAKVGAIIAFRQLDMSKATNWQPQMSAYRVAEVHQVLGNGNLNVRLAVRDRRPKTNHVDSEDGEPREYSGFEMPGMDDEDEEDDGYREVAIAELCEPKLLKHAPRVDNEAAGENEKEKNKDSGREGSTVSVVEDSMPNPQPSSPPPPIDMDLDETTFVTLVTAASRLQSPNESPARPFEQPSGRAPGAGRILIPRSGDADDEHSDTPAVPSPSFSGFHSARSSPGARLLGSRFHGSGESHSNLEGHTLIGDQSMLGADNSNQDISTLSFLSANQSFSGNQEDSPQHDRQVVEDTLVSGGNDSLLSVVHNPIEDGSAKTSPAPSAISASQGSAHEKASARLTPTQKGSLLDILERGWFGDDTDQEKDEPDNDPSLNDLEDRDSVLHSNQSRHLSPQPSPKPPTSAQQEPHSSPDLNADSLLQYDSPAASTRSKRPAVSLSASQPNFSQTSEIIDLTQSPRRPTSPERPASQGDQLGSSSKASGGYDSSSDRKSRVSSGKIQEMAEVMVSPEPSLRNSKKKKKKKSSGDL